MDPKYLDLIDRWWLLLREILMLQKLEIRPKNYCCCRQVIMFAVNYYVTGNYNVTGRAFYAILLVAGFV